MDQIYIVVLVALSILAVVDLMVGVSNDAVNFLNSAIGSKAFSFKTIMIIASIGILIGAFFSEGMMEVARANIMNPSMFTFKEVMFIFIAVMVTDVLLLDVFNSLGLPTSTTVSVIFEIMGAAFFIGLFKIFATDASFNTVWNYLNTDEVPKIIYSIFLSVLLAFTFGSIVQYITRLIFTFDINKRVNYLGGLFGGIAITSIMFFIFFKGLKSSSLLPSDVKTWMKEHQMMFILINFLTWTILSQALISIFKTNIFRIIIAVGTFALALAFAGNDLVNFIGVTVAGFDSYKIFIKSGGSDSILMNELANVKDPANLIFIFISGIIMVYTLWTSKKAKSVTETEINLSRQGDGDERFEPNFVSRQIVRATIYVGNVFTYVIPKNFQEKLEKQFKKPLVAVKSSDEPMFDLIRACVNLMVASSLIAYGTSQGKPLSTTYVTFMVAMGTSFADRAWDRESAVYRVSGVINVILGWFITAIVAFLVAGTVATLLKFGEIFTFFGLMILVAFILVRSKKLHDKKSKEKEELKNLTKADIGNIKEMIKESSSNISKVFKKTGNIYSESIDGLGLQDLGKLKENKKKLKKLEQEVDSLKNNVYYVIKNLEENSLEASRIYILILGYLQDMTQSIGFIAGHSYAHVNNNHKKLKFNQTRDLKNIDNKLKLFFSDLENSFSNESYSEIDKLIKEKDELIQLINELITKQIDRIRTTETSPKNSKLYFSILLETNDLVKEMTGLLELFKEFNKLK